MSGVTLCYGPRCDSTLDSWIRNLLGEKLQVGTARRAPASTGSPLPDARA